MRILMFYVDNSLQNLTHLALYFVFSVHFVDKSIQIANIWWVIMFRKKIYQ